MITAANLLGLYSAFLHCKAICLRSRVVFKFTVDTTFLQKINQLKNYKNDQKSEKIILKLRVDIRTNLNILLSKNKKIIK